MSNYGQTFTKGVKYLKIHKLDKNGEDYGQRLAVADNIRINYPDVGNIQYNILTTQQLGDSYLMGVIPQETTSSLNNIKDYNIELDGTPQINNEYEETIIWYGTGNPSGGGMPGVTSGNTDGYYDNSTGVWTLNLPNTKLALTASLGIQGITGATVGYPIIWNFSLYPSGTLQQVLNGGNSSQLGVIFLGSVEISSTGIFEIETTINNIPGGKYYFGGSNSTLSNPSGIMAIDGVGFEIIQENSPYDSPNDILINITPEVLNFEYSDYNALLGNATIPQYSQKYQNVSYNTGLLSPTNIEFIRNGTAEKASINDSNYSQKAWSNSRYNGNRISSYDFNVANTNSNN
jgi:hypothetical protein